MPGMEARSVTFSVPGDPVPQPRARARVVGGFPAMYTPDDNGIKAYKSAIQLVSIAAGVGRFHGIVVEVFIEAVFARPKSHLLSSGKLRKGAPVLPLRADWDNIAKGVCDAIWGDDRRISDGRCKKRYAVPGEVARTIVTITEDIAYGTTERETTVHAG